MVVEEKNLLKERVLKTDLDFEMYEDDLKEAIGTVKEYYKFTESGVRKAMLIRKGYINEKSNHGAFHTCVQIKNFSYTDDFLIQIVEYGTLLFSEVYKGLPTKKKLISELEQLKNKY